MQLTVTLGLVLDSKAGGEDFPAKSRQFSASLIKSRASHPTRSVPGSIFSQSDRSASYIETVKNKVAECIS